MEQNCTTTENCETNTERSQSQNTSRGLVKSRDSKPRSKQSHLLSERVVLILLEVLRTRGAGKDKLPYHGANVHAKKALVPLPALARDTASGDVDVHNARQSAPADSGDKVVSCQDTDHEASLSNEPTAAVPSPSEFRHKPDPEELQMRPAAFPAEVGAVT